MLLTWKLWRAMRSPPAVGHAVFRRIATTPSFFPVRWSVKITDQMIWIILIPIMLIFVHYFGISGILIVFFGIPALIIIAILITPLALPIAVGLAGGMWAARISHTLVRERQSHTYDLLCAMPDGKLGANWAIASGSLHQGNIFSLLRAVMVLALLLGGALLALLMIVTVVLALRSNPTETIIVALRTICDIVVLLLLFYAHFVQSVVMSVLVGVFIPTHLSNRIDAPWIAFALTLVLQLGTLLILYFFMTIAGPVLGTLTPSTPVAFIGVPFVYLLFFLLLRDAVTLGLWHSITERLNAHSTERDYLIHLFS